MCVCVFKEFYWDIARCVYFWTVFCLCWVHWVSRMYVLTSSLINFLKCLFIISLLLPIISLLMDPTCTCMRSDHSPCVYFYPLSLFLSLIGHILLICLQIYWSFLLSCPVFYGCLLEEPKSHTFVLSARESNKKSGIKWHIHKTQKVVHMLGDQNWQISPTFNIVCFSKA